MDGKEAPKTLINRLEQEHYRHSILIGRSITVSFHNYLKIMALVLFISFALLATQVTAAQAGKHCCIISNTETAMPLKTS